MKAILEFDLPEDQEIFDISSNAMKYHSVLWDLDQYLRSKVKWGDDLKLDIPTYESVRGILAQYMRDEGVHFI